MKQILVDDHALKVLEVDNKLVNSLTIDNKPIIWEDNSLTAKDALKYTWSPINAGSFDGNTFTINTMQTGGGTFSFESKYVVSQFYILAPDYIGGFYVKIFSDISSETIILDGDQVIWIVQNSDYSIVVNGETTYTNIKGPIRIKVYNNSPSYLSLRLVFSAITGENCDYIIGYKTNAY